MTVTTYRTGLVTSVADYEMPASGCPIFLSGSGMAVIQEHNPVSFKAQTWLDRIDLEIERVGRLTSRYSVRRVLPDDAFLVDAPAGAQYVDIDSWQVVEATVENTGAEGFFGYQESDPQIWYP